MPMRVLVVVLLALGGCTTYGPPPGLDRNGRWVWEEVKIECRGGKIVQSRKTTDTMLGGRVRNTVTTLDACIE